MTTPARILVVRHEAECPPGLLAGAAVEARVRLDVVASDLGDELPADLGDAAALVVLGGTMDVSDAPAYPHLQATLALIREAAAFAVPALGICLGGQLAAHALGGRAYRSPSGAEYGWIRLELTPAGRLDPVLGALGGEPEVFSWHHDVFDPPPGAELLAIGGDSPTQAFRLGSVVGVQFHPEVDAGLVGLWHDQTSPPPPLPREVVVEAALRNAPRAQRMLEAFCRLAATEARTPPPRSRRRSA
jgi:GMP synthase (glutamine-hydrolysing)